MRILACILPLFMLGACGEEALLQKFSSPEIQATAIAYLDQLRAHDFTSIEKAADPSISNAELHGELEKMAALLPAKMPTSVKLVGSQTMRADGATTVNSTFEYNFDGTWMIASVAVREKNGVSTIAGMSVYPLRQSLESLNRFTLSGKSAIQYTVLAASLIAVLVTLYALVACIRTRLSGRKWPWILFILAGFGKIAVNWTTGAWEMAPLTVQLFSASAAAQIYGPWIVSASIPVGAICFLLRREKLRVPAG
ncbi:hypothetical protein [Duganella sp. Dugasp56]|jgi:hypothetical protein|uniref:hypothetical protein n=1 Tax=unclassified Duganella TaxID=2636909 RepID=UPI00159E282B